MDQFGDNFQESLGRAADEKIRRVRSLGSGRRGVWAVLITFAVIIMITNAPFGTVGAGERGIQLRFGAVTGEVFDEGLYFRIPFVERVQKRESLSVVYPHIHIGDGRGLCY